MLWPCTVFLVVLRRKVNWKTEADQMHACIKGTWECNTAPWNTDYTHGIFYVGMGEERKFCMARYQLVRFCRVTPLLMNVS